MTETYACRTRVARATVNTSKTPKDYTQPLLLSDPLHTICDAKPVCCSGWYCTTTLEGKKILTTMYFAIVPSIREQSPHMISFHTTHLYVLFYGHSSVSGSMCLDFQEWHVVNAFTPTLSIVARKEFERHIAQSVA
jgi:hypothetical protein